MTPEVQGSFSRHLVNLVYVAGDRYFSDIVATGDSIRLSLRPGAGKTAAELAAALRHDRLLSAAPAGDEVALRLAPGPTPRLDELYLDLGPFTQEAYSETRLLLKRRSGETSVDRIEVFRAATEEEEWRRFLARESDVVPFLSPAALSYLREVPSVRIVPYTESSTMALFFRCDSSVTSDAATRRGIAARLRRPAIATLAVGDAAAALPAPASEEPLIPARANLRLAYYAASRDHEQAAMVVEQQLLELGFQVTMVPMDATAMQAAVGAGGFDLMIFLGGRHLEFLTSRHPANIAHFESSAFDRALGEGREDEARAVLAREVPFTPLFVVRDHVALDRRLCGARPIAPSDLSWLADLHACGPGEVE